MVRDVASAPECLSKLDEMRVYAFNGNASDNFQVYHTNTSVLPRPPAGCTPVTRAGINGLTCPIAAQGSVPPTATLTASPASITAGQSATLSWNATNASSVTINQGIGAVSASGTRSVTPAATTLYTLTATNATGTATAQTTVTVTAAGTKTTPTITWNTPAAIIYGTALSGVQLNASTTVPGSFAYSPTSGTLLSAGAGQTLSVTFTPTDTAGFNPATATVAITVNKATPVITWANPADITSGTPLSGTQLNATTTPNVAGTFTYTPPSGTVLGVGAQQALSTSFSPASAANYNTATRTVRINVTATPTTQNNAARANSYDDAWQSEWVANARAILAGGSGQPGLVLWIGDSLTRDPALGEWAQRGAGKTTADQAITDWMHAGLSPQGIDSIDGFALATPYFCPARSFTVGDGLGAWDFMGSSSMPADSNPATARQKLLDCGTYPNALNLTTMLAALPRAQFAIPEVNLLASNPGVFTDLQRMVDLMIANHIVPIIITYSYRTDAAFNNLVDQYNTGLVQYAQSKGLPLVDLNKEMLARLPFSQWPGRFLSDGVHYTHGTALFPAASDPYASGGDPATHTTGDALTYDGYGLKGWLGVQKMKEIKALVVDSVPPTPPPVTVPNVVGMTNANAKSAITSANLTVGTETTASSTTVPAGSIVSQNPAGGTSAATGSAVSLVTSSGPPDTTPPTVTSITPASGATGLGATTTVRATFSEPMNAASISAATFALRNPANAVVTATVGYNAGTGVATLTPSQPLSPSTTYTATIAGGSAGVKDVAGNALAASVVASFTTAAASTALSIWSASAAPSTFATSDGSAVELGVKFRSDVAGTVTGVRFYKGTTTTGTHTGTLWTSTGTKLATATFTGETASGWQKVTFSTAVAIAANTVYIVSYHTNVGNYAYTHNTFATAGVDNGPLHALAAGVSGGNGVYRYGATALPNSSFNSSNYWVDVLFVPQ
jgi:hypothetical protein